MAIQTSEKYCQCGFNLIQVKKNEFEFFQELIDDKFKESKYLIKSEWVNEVKIRVFYSCFDFFITVSSVSSQHTKYFATVH